MDNIDVTIDDGIRTITINRPDASNAVDRKTADELHEAFIQFDQASDERVAILTGAGNNFCAGADLKAINDPQRRNRLDPAGKGGGPMGPTRLELSKPVIAAVSGYAVAGGLELSLAADLRVVDETAVFGVFCRRWGVPLIDGGTVRLPAVIGLGRALDLILTGRPVDAHEAHGIGLANRVVPPGEALSAAQELARSLTQFPQECMTTDRASVYRSLEMPFAQALRVEGAHGIAVVEHEGNTGATRFENGEGRHGSFD